MMETKKPFKKILSFVLSMVMMTAVLSALTACQTPPLTEYTITYNLDGGTNHTDNPATYTTDNFPLTIKEPTKTGYIFLGWTSEIHEQPTPNVKLLLGDEQNLNFTANWMENPEPGVIIYRLDGGTNNKDNPFEFTADDLPLTIAAPTKEGYVFKGWTTPDNSTKRLTIKIEEWEAVVLTANWVEAEPDGYANGKKLARDFTVTDLNGNKVTLSQFRGEKPVFISFWSYTCNYCIGEMKNIFSPIYEDKAFMEEFELLVIHSDLRSGLDSHLAENGVSYPFPIYDDDKKIALIGIDTATIYFENGWPCNYMVDKWGYLYNHERNAKASDPIKNFNYSILSNTTEMRTIVNGAIARARG